MKRYSLPIILASALLAQAASAQTSSSTPVIGYYKANVPTGLSAWVSGFVTKKDFQGQATSIAPGAPIGGEPTSVITQTGATFPTLGLHYVEILTAGITQGAILDIVSNTATTIRVKGAISGTPTYCVRRHATFGSTFKADGSGNAAGLVGFEDNIALENSDATQTVAYFDGTNWVNQVTNLPADDTIIYPGQGILITTLDNRVVTFGGGDVSYVKLGPTQIPVYATANNFIGVINPLVSTVAPTAIDSTTALAYGLASQAIPGGLAAFADNAATFARDGSFNTLNVYYTDGTDVINQVTNLVSNTDTIFNGSAVQVTPLSDAVYLLPQTFTTP